jgi:phosphoglucomutase
MQRLIGLKDQYDVAFACDTDHDRHGVVTRSGGLMEPNHYLSLLVDYLFRHRPQWSADAAVGKTVVSTALIDRVAKRLGRRLFEAPVGFKWFAPGLFDGSLGFGCEESAGASLLRRDGTAWVTDKDGLVPALLSAEITAREGKDPGELYVQLTRELGKPFASRVDAAATPAQKAKLAKLSPDQLKNDRLAGEKIEQVLDKAPGNGAAIGGIKAIAASGWFAARPSGTEAIYKIYAESFQSEEHLQALLTDAQGIVDAALA